MDCYLVDIKWLSEAFGGERIWSFNVKPTDGAAIFACPGKGWKGGKFYTY